MPNQSSNAHRRRIQAAVLRRKGGPLQIESLALEGPREAEVRVRFPSTLW